MKGLPPKTSKSISKIVEGKFDKLALSFLGIIPKIEENKSILFSTKRNSLVYLFFKALNSKKPTKQEKDLLKVILSIANGYIDGLKERTKSRILQEMNSYVLNKENRGVPAKTEDLKEIMQNEMDKAKKHFELIANTESNKTINYASAMKISKMAESHGEKDPTVFFMVTVDDRTGDEEFVLHLLPDKTTPRVWKLSEVKSEYHKKGDSTPSLCGLHPNCRCKINYLANGWGFDSEGKIKFKGVDWDEFKFQRKEYGLPRQGLKKAEDDTGSPMDHMYQTNRGSWELHDTAPAGLDHPDNITSPLHQHKTSHITESGHRTWTIKNPQTKDDQFKGASKRFFRDNENKYGEDSLKSLAGLVRQTSQHPDRHAVHTGDSRNQAIRSRHLYNMFKGKDGYSMKELNKDGKHKGWILTAERHPGGKTMQTVWYWDGKSLRTHHHGKKKYF